MSRLAAERARLVSEWRGDGCYRITGEVSLPVAPQRARECLTEPDLIRRWALAGKVRIRLTEENGLYVFTYRTSPSMSGAVYGELLVDEPRLVVRRYRNVRPSEVRRLRVDQERLVTYVLEPAPAGTLVRCSVDVRVRGLGMRGGTAAGRAEAASLGHSFERLALFAEGRRPLLRSILFFSIFPKAPVPL